MSDSDKGLAFIVSLILYTPCLMLDSFVGMKLWNWLLVPSAQLYEIAVPVLTFGSAFCLYFVLGYFTKARYIDLNENEMDGEKVWASLFIISWAKPLMILFFGWVVHNFIF